MSFGNRHPSYYIVLVLFLCLWVPKGNSCYNPVINCEAKQETIPCLSIKYDALSTSVSMGYIYPSQWGNKPEGIHVCCGWSSKYEVITAVSHLSIILDSSQCYILTTQVNKLNQLYAAFISKVNIKVKHEG